MSSFHPHKPAWKATPDEVNRVAVISQQELADPNPDLLCLIKRVVNDFDELEDSDPVDWALRVAAITNPLYEKMFQGSNFDRIRYRYTVYGWSYERLQVVYDDLTAAFGP